MSNPHRFSLVAVLCMSAVAWANPNSPDPRRSERESGEVARVRHHLETAEALLLKRDVSALTHAQRTAREQRIAELRAYRQRGVFPHNHRLLNRRTPVFVDEHGTRCAMAFLIEQSGDKALVSRIARTRNLAHIRDLAGEPELAAWLDGNGLTLGEAARIQPEYDGTAPEAHEAGTSPGVWAASTLGAGFGALGIGLNVSTAPGKNERNERGLLGVVFGLLGAGLGAPALSEDGGARALGAFDVGAGIVSVGLGIRQLNAKAEMRPVVASRAIAPALWRDGAGTRRVALVMRY